MYQAFRPRGSSDATDPSYQNLGPSPAMVHEGKPA
jgi:hypothetical protein